MQEAVDFLARSWWWVALVAVGLLVLRVFGEAVLEALLHILIEVVWAGVKRLAAVVWDNLRGLSRRRRRGRHRAG